MTGLHAVPQMPLYPGHVAQAASSHAQGILRTVPGSVACRLRMAEQILHQLLAGCPPGRVVGVDMEEKLLEAALGCFVAGCQLRLQGLGSTDRH